MSAEFVITPPDLDFLRDKTWEEIECFCGNMIPRKKAKYVLRVEGTFVNKKYYCLYTTGTCCLWQIPGKSEAMNETKLLQLWGNK